MTNLHHTQARYARSVLAAAALLVAPAMALVGCGPGTESPDAPLDAPAASPGLTVQWHLAGAFPYIAADRELTKIELRMKSLRMVGDSAPDDARTNKAQFKLEWKENKAPDAVQFSQAPIGQYTAVKTRLDGDAVESFKLEGRAMVNGIWYPYELEDFIVYSQTMPIAVALTPDNGQIIHITANFRALIDSVDFSLLESDFGKLEFSPGTELNKARAIMSNVFAITQQ